MRKTPSERFESLYEVDLESGCWVWQNNLAKDGYGTISVGGKSRAAHRLGYELYRGEIPPGLYIDRLCRNRACVNPAHLEAVTNKENILRGMGSPAVNARKNECKRGHELSSANLYTTGGKRSCKKCYQTHAETRAKRLGYRVCAKCQKKFLSQNKVATFCSKHCAFFGVPKRLKANRDI